MRWLLCLLVLTIAGSGVPVSGFAARETQYAPGSAAGAGASLHAPPENVPGGADMTASQRSFTLPRAALDGGHRLAALLAQRRSVRRFASTPITPAQVGQLLWAAQGITAGRLRTAPSAGALYPLELCLVAGDIDGLPAGLYQYEPRGHRLRLVFSGDLRRALASAAAGQTWLATAPATIVFGAVPARTSAKYGARADRFVHIEVGHAAQSLSLQAEDLGLGTTDVGSFDDREVARVLRFSSGMVPLLLMPVGVPR